MFNSPANLKSRLPRRARRPMRELCPLLCCLALSAAQVTLLLDMGTDEGSDELFVGGGSSVSMLGLVPPGLAMTSLGNGLWHVNTSAFTVGATVTYKFRNGSSDNWDTGATWESLTSAECTVPVRGYDEHRQLVVSDSQPQIVGPVCFNSCAACPPRPPSLPPSPPSLPSPPTLPPLPPLPPPSPPSKPTPSPPPSTLPRPPPSPPSSPSPPAAPPQLVVTVTTTVISATAAGGASLVVLLLVCCYLAFRRRSRRSSLADGTEHAVRYQGGHFTSTAQAPHQAGHSAIEVAIANVRRVLGKVRQPLPLPPPLPPPSPLPLPLPLSLPLPLPLRSSRFGARR